MHVCRVRTVGALGKKQGTHSEADGKRLLFNLGEAAEGLVDAAQPLLVAPFDDDARNLEAASEKKAQGPESAGNRCESPVRLPFRSSCAAS